MKDIMVSRLAFLVVLVLLVSCKVGYQKLTNKREEYLGNEIKTNGYFYRIDTVYSKSLGQSRMEIVARVYFFYRNGVTHYSNTPFLGFEQLENYFRDVKEMSEWKLRPYSWGIYIVRDKRMTVEIWVSSTGGKHPNLSQHITILNDSTIRKSYKNDIYYYKNFKPKPDSVNSYTN